MIEAFIPHDRSFPAQPISIRKAQSRKKPINLCAPREFIQKCLPCLIIIQSCYFDFRINELEHTLAVWSAFRALFTWPRRTRIGSYFFYSLERIFKSASLSLSSGRRLVGLGRVERLRCNLWRRITNTHAHLYQPSSSQWRRFLLGH